MKWLLMTIVLLASACGGAERVQLDKGPGPRTAIAVCHGKPFALDHATSGFAPYVTLALAGKSGPFLIDYGASDSVVESGIWLTPSGDPRWKPSPAGAKFPLGPIDLPGWDAPAGKIDFLIEARDINLRPGAKQLGVLGADLFPNQIVHFSYTGPDTVHISPYPAPECSASTLQRAGFTQVDQSGHWADGTVAPDGIHNGPVLHGRFLGAQGQALEGTALWGQLDTGYDDIAYPHSLIVNEPLFDALSRSGLTLRRVGWVTTKTCAGTAQAEVMAAGEPLAITTGTDAIGSVRNVHIVRSPKTACGGISGAAVPAGQFGASFLEAIGEVVVHAPRKEVWLKF